jgi:hypothetical protein
MDTSAIFVRTEQGQNGFASGASQLSSAQRTVLILVDGTRRAADINRVVQAVCNGYATLGQLTDMGFISLHANASVQLGATLPERVPRAEALAEAKHYAAKTLVDTLGPIADRVCLKIELAQNAREVMESITQAHRMMRDCAGAARANAFEAHIKYLLADELPQAAA